MISSVAFGFSVLNHNSENSNLSRRRLRDATNVLELPENRFNANFRVNKEVSLMLLGEIEPLMRRNTRSSSVPAIIKVSTFLKFVASGGYQFCVGNECVVLISKSKVSEIISECLDIFEKYICPKWICLQKTPEEEEETRRSFYSSSGLPGVVGCVDGTHVRIKSPGRRKQHLYYNRKGYYSINVMAICDHNMVINCVDAIHASANHDAFVWERSIAHKYFKSNYVRGKRNTWLLGDSGYKLQPYMMTPYRNPTTTAEKKYNEKHCMVRNVVERCFGVLKNRFRCIIGSRGLHYSPQKATQIVNACCALHNICIFYKSNIPPINAVAESEIDCSDLSTSGTDTVAVSVRDEIASNLIH